MNVRLRWLGCACIGLLLCISLAWCIGQGQGPSKKIDLAATLPDSTLIYLELPHGPVIPEVRKLLKGSAFDDLPAFLASKRPLGGEFGYGGEWRSLFGSLLSPESLAELARVRSQALAVLPPTRESYGSPGFLWVIDPGESNVPAIWVRSYLAIARDSRVAGRIEGTNVYGLARSYESYGSGFPGIYGIGSRPYPKKTAYATEPFRDFPRETRPEPKATRKFEPKGTRCEPGDECGGQPEDPVQQKLPPNWHWHGPFVAMLPNLIVVGSDLDSVSQVVARARGKGDGKSLRDRPDFQEALALRDKPGLVGWINAKACADPKGPLAGKPEERHFYRPGDELLLPFAFLKEALGVDALALHLGLQNGEVSFQVRGTFDPAVKNSLRQRLHKNPKGGDLLQYVPTDTFAFLNVRSDGAQGLLEVAEHLDAATLKLIKLRGQPPPPRDFGFADFIARAEKTLKAQGIADGLTRLNDEAIAVVPLPNGQFSMVVLVQAHDEENAKRLQQALVTLFSAGLGGDVPAVTTRQVKGFPIVSPEAAAGHLGLQHAGRDGKVIVLADTPEQAAQLLAIGKERRGLGSAGEVKQVLQSVQSSSIVGLWQMATPLERSMKESTRNTQRYIEQMKKNRQEQMRREQEEIQRFLDQAPREERERWAKRFQVQKDEIERWEKQIQGMLTASNRLERELRKLTPELLPGAFGVSVEDRCIRLTANQSGLLAPAPQLINVLLEWSLTQEQMYGYGYYQRHFDGPGRWDHERDFKSTR